MPCTLTCHMHCRGMRTQCANCRQSNAVSNRTLIVHTSSDDASVVSPSATSLGTAADASEPNAVQADAHTVPPECIQLEPPLHMKPPLAQCTLPQERLDSTVKQYQIPQKERTQETQHLFWFFLGAQSWLLHSASRTSFPHIPTHKSA